MILPSILALEDPHTRMKDLLRHTMEAPLSGLLGIGLHLVQKPKLGGGIPTSHSFIYHILSVLCISIFCFLLFLLLFYFGFPKHKKHKNISVVSLHLFI